MSGLITSGDTFLKNAKTVTSKLKKTGKSPVGKSVLKAGLAGAQAASQVPKQGNGLFDRQGFGANVSSGVNPFSVFTAATAKSLSEDVVKYVTTDKKNDVDDKDKSSTKKKKSSDTKLDKENSTSKTKSKSSESNSDNASFLDVLESVSEKDRENIGKAAETLQKFHKLIVNK